jgi:hypothetical protein
MNYCFFNSPSQLTVWITYVYPNKLPKQSTLNTFTDIGNTVACLLQSWTWQMNPLRIRVVSLSLYTYELYTNGPVIRTIYIYISDRKMGDDISQKSGWCDFLQSVRWSGNTLASEEPSGSWQCSEEKKSHWNLAWPPILFLHSPLSFPSSSLTSLPFASISQNFYTRNWWVFGLCPSSQILNNATFRKLNLFASSAEGVGDNYPVQYVTKS